VTNERYQIQYLPSPGEIATACATIRARWTPRERQRRCVGRMLLEEFANAWRPPVIDTSALRSASGKSMVNLVS
jgi:hypothetical protein